MSGVDGPVPCARLTAEVAGTPVTVTACGFTVDEAGARARGRLHALYGLDAATATATADGGSPTDGHGTAGDRALRLADFAPETDRDDEDGAGSGAGDGAGRTVVVGAASGRAHTVPSEIVLPVPPSDRALVGAVYGPPGTTVEDLAGPAVADVLAADIAVRWWRRPRPVLARMPAFSLLPAGAARAFAAHGLEIEAYTWTNQPFTVVLAMVHEGGGVAAGFGVAAAADRCAALHSAVLRAQTMRLALDEAWKERRPVPSRDVPAPTARALAAWQGGPVQLDLLSRHVAGHVARGAAVVPDGEGPRTADDWIEQACRRFGHEPLLVSAAAADGGTVVKALCPGAAVYRPAAPALPACPF